MKYYISFIEECIQHPKYLKYTGGRIEVYKKDSPYASEEIRWFTWKVNKFREFRDKWDMKNVSEKQLGMIRKIAEGFCKVPKLSSNT